MRRLTFCFCTGTLLLGAVACSDDDTSSSETTESTTAPEGPQPVNTTTFDDLEPGTYFVDPDGDEATPLRATFDVAEEGWSSWIGTVKFSDAGHTAISIMTVKNLVTEACTDHAPADPAVGPSVDDLANTLVALQPFEVSAAPTDVTVLGYEGKHLQLTVPDMEITGSGDSAEYAGCVDGNLASWIGDYDNAAFYGYNPEPGRTEDFWILDVDGTRLVLETNGGPSSPAEDVSEMQAIFDSIQIET